MRQTHGFQNQPTGIQAQAEAANEVAPSTEPESPSRQPAETLLESLGNTKRSRRSDEEYTTSTNHPLDTIPARPAKRRKKFTCDYANPITTDTPQGDTPTRAQETHDIVSLTDTPRSHPDTKKCIQIGSETYAVTSQPGTPYTFDPGIDTGTLQGQRLQPVTNPACDDYDSIVVLDPSGPPDHVHSGKKKRLQYRVRKKMHTNTSNSDRTTP